MRARARRIPRYPKLCDERVKTRSVFSTLRFAGASLDAVVEVRRTYVIRVIRQAEGTLLAARDMDKVCLGLLSGAGRRRNN